MQRTTARTIATAVALAVLAGCTSTTAGQATTATGDDVFLTILDNTAFPYPEGDAVTEAGRSICTSLEAGNSRSSSEQAMRAVGFSSSEADRLVAAAIAAYCPGQQ